MCGQDEENTKEVEDPGQGVNEVPAPGSVCRGDQNSETTARRQEKQNFVLSGHFYTQRLILNIYTSP